MSMCSSWVLFFRLGTVWCLLLSPNLVLEISTTISNLYAKFRRFFPPGNAMNLRKFFHRIFFSWKKKVLENSVLVRKLSWNFPKMISPKNGQSWNFQFWNFPLLGFFFVLELSTPGIIFHGIYLLPFGQLKWCWLLRSYEWVLSHSRYSYNFCWDFFHIKCNIYSICGLMFYLLCICYPCRYSFLLAGFYFHFGLMLTVLNDAAVIRVLGTKSTRSNA